MDRNLFYFLMFSLLFIFICLPTGCCIYRLITTKEYNKRKNYSNNEIVNNNINKSNINYQEEDPLIHKV